MNVVYLIESNYSKRKETDQSLVGFKDNNMVLTKFLQSEGSLASDTRDKTFSTVSFTKVIQVVIAGERFKIT